MNSDAAKRAAIAWLDTVVPNLAPTIVRSPTFTIVPNTIADGNADADLGGHDVVELRIGEVIGEGGMGLIRDAEQVSLARTVAVKTIRHVRRGPESRLELLREAWITGSLEHPNVVPVHHLGVDDDGSPLLVLKRVEGVEWSRLRADAAEVERRFATTDLLAWNLGILLQVLNAVRFAHSRGVIHRDLKPSNVMIGEFGEVYLLDWGIAVSTVDDGSGRLPLARDADVLAGTPCYMAPEMLARQGDPRPSAATDIYLAGAVLFELITGAPPHRGGSAVEIITNVILSQPELPNSVPVELAAICRRAMEPEPTERFASIGDMNLAIREYLEHRTSEQIATRATLSLLELVATLSNAVVDREAVYRLLGACRAGFQEALAAWHDNAAARAGLTEATVAVAQFELAHDAPQAAVRLLGELEFPTPLLEVARAATAAQASRQEGLESLRRDHDPSIGRRTRTALGVIVGICFTAIPLVAGLWPTPLFVPSHPMYIAWATLCLALSSAGLYYGRESLSRTWLNRHTAISIILAFAAQFVVCIGGWLSNISITQQEIVMPLAWAVIAAMGAMSIHRYFAIAAVGYVAAFLLGSRFPDRHLLYTAMGNFTFALVMWRSWQPATATPAAKQSPTSNN